MPEFDLDKPLERAEFRKLIDAMLSSASGELAHALGSVHDDTAPSDCACHLADAQTHAKLNRLTARLVDHLTTIRSALDRGQGDEVISQHMTTVGVLLDRRSQVVSGALATAGHWERRP